ncbi:hypothetical protein F66182_17304, partial [Fusarium sp. NRRL 66182]
MINFCWPIGITATVETFLHSPPYLFDEIQAASMRFAGVIGAVSGSSLMPDYLGIWIMLTQYRSKNDTAAGNKNSANDELGRTASENSSLQIADALVSFSAHHDGGEQHQMTSSTIPGWRPEYRLHGVWIPVASLAGGLVT